MQVQQQERQAWQAFCAASVRVVPSEAARVEGMQDGQGGLYQQRLPQLADKMQGLLSEAGLAGPSAQGGPSDQLPSYTCLSSFVLQVSTVTRRPVSRGT